MQPNEFVLAHRDEILDSNRERLQNEDPPSSAEHIDDALERSSSSQEKPPHALAIAIVGRSAPMVRLRHDVGQLVRRSRAPVLIVGETGAGRRHCAVALHCGTYPEGDFFDLEADARILPLDQRLALMRTRMSAPSTAGMTVYVHDIARTSAAVQLCLAKLLQEQSLQLRVVVSCTRDVVQARENYPVRPDLLFRFRTVLELPTLRDRAEDIPELVRHFAERSAHDRGSAVCAFSLAALERLQRYSWPRNLSELATTVERACLNVRRGTVSELDLPDLEERPSGVFFKLPATGIDLAELERGLLTQALTMARNNQTRAAALLGLTRDQMRYRLAKFAIQPATEPTRFLSAASERPDSARVSDAAGAFGAPCWHGKCTRLIRYLNIEEASLEHEYDSTQYHCAAHPWQPLWHRMRWFDPASAGRQQRKRH